MITRRTGWLLTVPLALAGTEVAHALAYRLVTNDHPAGLLASTGHGYLQYAPAAIGLGLGLALVALALRIAAAARSRGGGSVSAWPFALLPPLTFAFQEHLERFIHSGAVPVGAALQPTFLVGLALQIPFAVLAYRGARALLRVADTAGRLLGGREPLRRGRAAAAVLLVPRAPEPAPVSALALGHAERGPPSPR